MKICQRVGSRYAYDYSYHLSMTPLKHRTPPFRGHTLDAVGAQLRCHMEMRYTDLVQT